MVYFDKEKGEFVWFHIETGESGIEHLREKATHICLIIVPGTIYTREEAERFKSLMKKNDVFVYIPASVPNNTEERMRWALNYLNSQEAKDQGCAIKEGYDYAWIKRVIDKNLFAGANRVKNKSFPSFVSYINNFKLEIQNVASSTVLSRYYKKAKDCCENGSLPWLYKDCQYDRNETNRRNTLAMTFLGIMTDYSR